MFYKTSPVVSTYRHQSVESLIRIHNVTGQDFPISGDAPLRMATRLLKIRMNAEYAKHVGGVYQDTDSLRKIEHSSHYGKGECTC